MHTVVTMLKYVSYVLVPRSANRLPTSRQLNKPIVRRCAVKNYSLFRPQYDPYLSIIYN